MANCVNCGRETNPNVQTSYRCDCTAPIEAPAQYETRTIALAVGDEYRVEINRYGGEKPFVVVHCSGHGDSIDIDPEAWPSLCAAVDDMISQCRGGNRIMKYEHNEKCKACKGTGLYVGLAERDGAAVVCSKCKGTGCFQYKYEYEPFQGREETTDVKRVYETNPGIVIGEGSSLRLEGFGGMPFKKWEAGFPFPPGSENRKYTCPRWWYQCVNFERGPRWDRCDNSLGKRFEACQFFGRKSECWSRFDKEATE